MSWGDDGYQVVAVVSAGGEQRAVECSERPSPQEVNLLYALGEHVSRVLTWDDLCFRLRVSVNALRITACTLRKKLHHDWAIQAVNGSGMRLCYIGSPLADADRTYMEVDPAAIRRTRVQSEETRAKIRATQIRKEAYVYFQGRAAYNSRYERDTDERRAPERQTG